jgi:hypothetical protein
MATNFSKIDIKKEGKKFVTTVLNDPNFKKDGFLYGHKPDWLWWAAVDGARHPLYVWEKSGIANYPESAKKLGSAAFSNGPMMANPSLSSPRPPSLGPVHGDHHKVDDKGAGNVDAWLYLFGRKTAAPSGIVFTDYEIKKSDDPKGYTEVITALIPLVVNSQPCSVHPKKGGVADPMFNEGYRDLIEGQPGHDGNKRVDGWALVPVAAASTAGDDKQNDTKGEKSTDPGGAAATASGGIVLAIGTVWDGHIKEIVSILVSIGTRDAVAMDGSTSVMLGEHGEAWFTPEGGAGTVKNIWQKYGFCCGGT